MKRVQTWHLLSEALLEIKYIRDEPPPGHKRFELIEHADENYAVLHIFTYNPDTYAPAQMRYTRHEFVVPVATYNKASWTRWIFDRIESIERHETCESFLVNGVRIYAPHHGNGWDPYVVWYDGHPDEQAKAPGDD